MTQTDCAGATLQRSRDRGQRHVGNGRIKHHEHHGSQHGGDRGPAPQTPPVRRQTPPHGMDERAAHGTPAVQAPFRSTYRVTRCSSVSSRFRSRSVKRNSSAGPARTGCHEYLRADTRWTCPGRTSVESLFTSSTPPSGFLDPGIGSHLDFALLHRVDDPPPAVIMGRPIQAGVFRVRQQHEPVRRVPVQLLVGRSFPVQCRQPLLRGGRIEEFFQVAPTTSDHFGAERSPDRLDALDRRFKCIGGHVLSSGSSRTEPVQACGHKLATMPTWRKTHHLHCIRASDATSGAGCARLPACRHRISTC